MVSYFLGQLAEAHHLAGDDSTALELLDSAIELGDKTDEHFYDAELYRIRGELRLASARDTADGVDDLIRAVEKARDQQATSFELRALVSLLTAPCGPPQRGDWLLQLKNALHRLTSSEDGRDEHQARALIARELST